MASLPPRARPRSRTSWQIQKAVVFALLQRDFMAQLGGRWMGVFWLLAEPLAHVGVPMLIYSYLRQRIAPGHVPYPLFLITGMIPFLIFKSLALRVMAAVETSRGLFNYRQVKPFDALLSRAGYELLVALAVFGTFLFGMGWFGLQWLPAQPIEWLASGVALGGLGFGLGLISAVATDDVPQLRVFIRISFMPLYFLSGVIFPVSAIPSDMREWLLWNPVLHLVETQRSYFITGYHALDEVSLAYPTQLAVVALALGMALYRQRRHHLLTR